MTTRSSWIAIVLLSAFLILAQPSTAQTPAPLNTPEGMAFDSNGNLYVANYGSNQVLVYNRQGVQRSVITAGLNGPNRLAFDTLGNLYVSNDKGPITVYDAVGNQVPSKTITNGVLSPQGVAVDAYGDVFVANNPRNNITVYNADGTLVETLTKDKNGRTFSAPGVLAINGMNIYVGTGPTVGQSYVSTYNVGEFLTGNLIEGTSYFDTEDQGPTGIAFDGAGNVYVSDFYTATVVKYSPAGKVLSKISTGSCCQNQGVAVDKQGNIYASFGTDTINVYNSQGVLIKTIH